MRRYYIIPMLALVVLGSCTVYRTGPMPDDLYYANAPQRVVRNSGYVPMDNDNYPEDNYSYGDNYLRMKSYNRNRWSTFDNDYGYWNDSRWNNQLYFNSFRPSMGFYGGLGMGFGSPYSSFGSSLFFGNPYSMFSPYSMFNSYSLWGNPYSAWGGGGLYGDYWGSSYYYMNPFSPLYYGRPVVVINNYNRDPRVYAPRTSNLNTYNFRNTNPTGIAAPRAGVRTYDISSYPSRSSSGGNSGYSNSRSGGGSYYNMGSGGGGNVNPYRSFSGGSTRGGGGYIQPISGGSSSGGSYGGSSGSSSGGGGGRSSSSGSSSAPVRSFPRGGH